MKNKGPVFSVVIPTFNRSGLLPLAIRSVFKQSIDDIEVVISNGGSTDDTADVVRSFGDPRIKYVESPKRLTIAENYQQGLNNAAGEYITFLSDDDAYTPKLLETVSNVIERTGADMVGYQYCRYYHDELYDFDTRVPANSLLIHSYTGAETGFSKESALEQSMVACGLSDASCHPQFIIPYLSNATYHRKIFDTLMQKKANLFDSVPPDLYLATAAFFVAVKYFCLDLPLLVWSNWAGNATATATRQNYDHRGHYRKQLGGRELAYTPLKNVLPPNLAAECALSALAENNNYSFEPHWATYFKTIYEHFAFLESVGVDVGEEREDFEAVLAFQPQDIRAEVNTFRRKPLFRIKSEFNRRIPGAMSGLRRLLSPARAGNFRIKRGEELGFSNVAEAAQFVF